MDFTQFLDYASQAVAQIPVPFQNGNYQPNPAPNVNMVHQIFVQSLVPNVQQLQPSLLSQPTFVPIEVLALDNDTWMIPAALSNAAQPVQPPLDSDEAIPDKQSQTRIEGTVESVAANSGEEADSSELNRSKRGRKTKYPYSPDDLQAAIHAYRTGSLKLRESSEKYGIPPGTLCYHLYAKKQVKTNSNNPQLQQAHSLQPAQPFTTTDSQHVTAEQSLVPKETLPDYNMLPPEQLQLINQFSGTGVSDIGASQADTSERDQAQNVSVRRRMPRCLYSPEDLQAAIQAVRTGSLINREAAKKYGIPKGTLLSKLHFIRHWEEKESMQPQKTHGLQSFQQVTTMDSQHLPAIQNPRAHVPIKRKNYTEDAMNKAVDAVRGGNFTVSRASRVYKVPPSTIYNRIHKRLQPNETSK